MAERIRVAHVDAGEGSPILLLHGEPAWSFIWRKTIPPLVAAGHRCVAPDHAGCGRSDKPTDLGWYTVEHHRAITSSLLDDLDLRDVTLVVHDWGGAIGLPLAIARPDRIARIVVLDTVLDPTEVWISERWVEFREFVERTDDIPVAWVMRTTCSTDPGDDVLAAYDAPHLGPESKVALRAMPMSVERTTETPPEAAKLLEALRRDTRPMRIIWGENDTVLTAQIAERLATSIGRHVDEWIPGAGHGLPEDQGPLLGKRIAAWLAEVAPPA
ncbi:MAG: alpha/beta fold hydrolase [Solirubrobacterales bacterium]